MRVSAAPRGRHFIKDDGSPFFWLADTAWNAPLRGDTAAWERYLAAREKQGFTVIQFVTTPWRGCRSPLHGSLFTQGPGAVSYDEHAWAKMEEWLGSIVAHGMVPAPVMIWDNNPDDSLFALRDDTCIALGRRMLERWRRFNPVWILAGDGNYHSARQDRKWKTIGRAVFHDFPSEIATMHPCGITWVGDQFAAEPWYTFVGIQSGHGSSPTDLGFLLSGPYSTRWREIEKPFINLELNYELARSYQDRALRYGAYHVRRACWWSLLGAPTAGVTYGNNPIWIWSSSANERAEGHDEIWSGDPWEGGLQTEGIAHLGAARRILSGLPWTGLLPADHLLGVQPGWGDAAAFQKVAATTDLTTVLAYLPLGGAIRFVAARLSRIGAARWICPRTGSERACTPTMDRDRAFLHYAAPDSRDWLLLLEGDGP